MSEYLDIQTKEKLAPEIKALCDLYKVKAHIGKSQLLSTSTVEALHFIINALPHASIAAVLIAWINARKERTIIIKYPDKTEITIKGPQANNPKHIADTLKSTMPYAIEMKEDDDA